MGIEELELACSLSVKGHSTLYIDIRISMNMAPIVYLCALILDSYQHQPA